MYIEELPLTGYQVGWGDIGLHGSLGYDAKQVTVEGRSYTHAISAHPPSNTSFNLNGPFSVFRCQVALNDDVFHELTSADFMVYADGVLVGMVRGMQAGHTPKELQADIRGAHSLELVVNTRRWDSCHAVWLDPEVCSSTESLCAGRVTDCLERTEICLPPNTITADRCIATVVSPSYTSFIDDMLGSLFANGQCQDAMAVIFAIDPNEECRAVAAKYGAPIVECRSLCRVQPMVKSVLYSAALAVNARQYLCLDADILVVGDLRPIFYALDACTEGTALVCEDEYIAGIAHNLGEALTRFYRGHDGDIAFLTGGADDVRNYPIVVNDGVFASDRAGMLSIDKYLRSLLPRSSDWMKQDEEHNSRNQFLFNLALAHLNCGVTLNRTYNTLTVAHDITKSPDGGIRSQEDGKRVRVLHFAGAGRMKNSELRGVYSKVSDPLINNGDGDTYNDFLKALRKWIGINGTHALTWSVYGTDDGDDGFVRDPSTFPLLATLHYLIRGNGCERVIESGTGRGVSTACLAAAVSNRRGGRIVTIDKEVLIERETLWSQLEPKVKDRIEARRMEAIAGLSQALEAGETYEAAFLDSTHDADHVWDEFLLAIQLVCKGGIILIHDPCYRGGNVGEAIERIKRAGFGVVRLWTADGGIRADDHLGLALIENRVIACGGLLGDLPFPPP